MVAGSLIRRAAANTGIVFIGQILAKLISLLVVVYLVRYLDEAGFGRYALVFAYLGFFSLITDFGLDQIIVRDMASDRGSLEKLLGNAIVLKLVFSMIAVGLSWLILLVLDYPFYTKLLIMVASASLIFSYQSPSFGNVFTTIFTANLSRVYVTVIDLGIKAGVAACTLLLIALKRSLLDIVLINVFGLAAGFFVLYFLSLRFIKPDFSLDFYLWKYLLRQSLPLALSSFFVMVYFRVDVILLSLWQTEKAIGYYAAAYRLTESFTMIGSAFIVTLLPLASRFYASAKESMIRAYQLSMKYLLILMIPVGIGTTYFSRDIMVLIDHKYAASSTALGILVWAELFILLNMAISTFMISIRRQKVFFFMTFGLMFLNVFLNYLLIPRLSFVGASIATVATEAAFTVAGLIYLGWKHNLTPDFTLARLIPVNLAFFILLSYAPKVSLFLVVPLSAVAYFALLLFFRGIGRVELDLLKRVFASA
jgi:O-antigen/teichoic acid export membrane protein